MATKKQKHQITKENIDSFVGELATLLQKYGAHIDKSDIKLKTVNFDLHAKHVGFCPPECESVHKRCNIKTKKCELVYECTC